MSETDYSKTRLYVICDLITKTLASIALILLGYVGWRLQYDTHAQEVHNRKYLPEIQALTGLQIALSTAAVKLEQGSDQKSYNAELFKFASQVRYLNNSLQLTKDVDQDIKITSFINSLGPLTIQRRDITVSIKKATSMAEELLLYLPRIDTICQNNKKSKNLDYVFMLSNKPALYLAAEKDVDLPGDVYLRLNPGNFATWKKWFPSRKKAIYMSSLCNNDFDILMRDIASGAGEISGSIIRNHPEVSEKAVEIRINSLRVQNGLFDKN